MEIIVGKTSGFCQGVSYTVKKAYEALEENEKVYCLGEIVHNERVVDNLKDRGMIFVESLAEIPKNSKVIIRAHGEPKNTYDEIKEKELDLLDLTCGRIRVIKNKIEENKADSFIIMIGKKNHPETIGTISFCESGMIVEDEEDFSLLKQKIIKSKKEKIYVLSQTTFNEGLFNNIVERIKDEFKEYAITINNTICNATHERQEETKQIAQETDMMIIIGGKHSSNTKELFNIAQKNCENTILIQDYKELNYENLCQNVNKVGIMAGASTAKEAIDEVVENINKYCGNI